MTQPSEITNYDYDDDIRSIIEQNCRVIEREDAESHARVNQLARTYLAREPPLTTSRRDVCRMLSHRFAMDGLRLTVDDTGVVTQPSSVRQINDRVWVGRKNGQTYVMERIDQDKRRKDFWKQWVLAEMGANRTYVKTYDTTLTERQRHFKFPDAKNTPWDRISFFSVGRSSFSESLSLSGVHELWVAFATPTTIKTESDVHNLPPQDVEMTITAMTDPDAPMVEHMGIQRSFQYALAGHDVHNGLAIPLHSFIARVMLTRQSNKLYMISAPVTTMTTIIQRALPFHTYVGSVWHDMLRRLNPDLPPEEINALVRAKVTAPNESPLSYLMDEQYNVTWMGLLDATRTRLIFEYTRDTVKEDEAFGPIHVNSDHVAIHPVYRGGSPMVVHGRNARDRFNWLFHSDLMPGLGMNEGMIVDYRALAYNF